jgi:hypothetical protein
MPTWSRRGEARAAPPARLAGLAAGLLLAAAALAHAQDVGRFAFASREHARAVLGARDDYVRATAALERSVLLRTPDAASADRLATAMRDTSLEWTEEEKRSLNDVLDSLEGFISKMRWRSPPRIWLVKAADRLMDGFPHTRGHSIVVQEGVLRDARSRPALLEYLLAHETFHVLSRADARLREELYGAIGFRACAAVEFPDALARLRLTNPDAPENRHTIGVRRAGRPLEAMPFVHLPPDKLEPRAGFSGQIRTAWLPVDREGGRCKVRNEPVPVDELEGLYEQVGRNTAYVIHPEEILADNFALIFRIVARDAPQKTASPELLERIRRILQ